MYCQVNDAEFYVSDGIIASSASENQPLLLGDYRVVRSDKYCLGTGGYAVVWLGEHQRNPENKVAIKEVCFRNKDNIIRIQGEIKVLSHFDHKNIVKLYDVHEKENRMYVIMHYCVGGNLEAYVWHQDISFDLCLEYIEHIAAGLEYIHSQNVSHRDLKPTNILVDQYSENTICLRIGDYGYSIELTDGSSSDITATGNIGTTPWVAPEVLRDAEQSKSIYSQEADVFSFALVAWSLLNHRRGHYLRPYVGRYIFFVCYYLHGKIGYVFGSVGLFVCLFVSTITQKVMNGLP